LLLVFVLVTALNKPKGFPLEQASNPTTALPSAIQTLTYTQKVSHFNFAFTGKTWKQKYLIDIASWSKSEKGPILMYCGNEGPIEVFYRNTGWYNDVVSKELKGLLVYPEHRYFGESWPFGDQKTSLLK